MGPFWATATNFEKSAEEAIDCQSPAGALVAAHVVPEFVETQIGPLNSAAAAKCVPFAEDATDCQYTLGTLFDIQVAPELVEV